MLIQRDRLGLEHARSVLRQCGPDPSELYRRWFHRESGQQLRWPGASAYRGKLVEVGSYQPGWTVVGPVRGRASAVCVTRDGRERVVAPPEVVPEHAGVLTLRPGDAVRVQALAGDYVGGFWHIWSSGWQAAPPVAHKRVYCSVSPATSLSFVAAVLSLAPREGIWSMKALCDTHDAGRVDGALLYLPLEQSLQEGWVPNVVREVSRLCSARLPPFVEPLDAGVGWAPDPGQDRSFGEAVCAAIATAYGSVEDASRFARTALDAIRALPGMTSLHAETLSGEPQ